MKTHNLKKILRTYFIRKVLSRFPKISTNNNSKDNRIGFQMDSETYLTIPQKKKEKEVNIKGRRTLHNQKKSQRK